MLKEVKSKLKIAVLRWWIGTEREISLLSGQEVIKRLNPEKYEIFDFQFDSPRELIKKLENTDIDYAFLALHGKFWEDGTVQAILESFSIPYLGSGVMSSAICMDKNMTQTILKSVGVRTSDGTLLRNSFWKSMKELQKNMPEYFEEIRQDVLKDFRLSLDNWGKLIIKPNKWGSSFGIKIVEKESDFFSILNEAFEMDNEILLEKVIEGNEISVPIIHWQVYPTIEIKPKLGKFFDYQSKYQNEWNEETVYQFKNETEKAEVEWFAKTAFNVLKCKDLARVDMIICNGKAYVLEVNTLPWLTSYSLLPKSVMSTGLTYGEMLDLLIDWGKYPPDGRSENDWI